jgi:hypothetical protein
MMRNFKRFSWRGKAYVAAQLAGPLGITLGAVGALGHDHTLLIVGIVLAGVFFLDSAVLFPILRARHGLGGRRKQPPKSGQRTR